MLNAEFKDKSQYELKDYPALQDKHDSISENALIHLIYQSALDQKLWPNLRKKLLIRYREDKEPSENLQIGHILGHIKRALRLGTKHSALQRERYQLNQVLNELSPPIIWIDASLRVLGVNETAEKWLLNRSNNAPYFVINNGFLESDYADFIVNLRLSMQSEQGVISSIHSTLNGIESSLCLHFALFQSQSDSSTFQLILFDKGINIEHAADSLSLRYGLSDKENLVMRSLVNDSDLNAVSDALNISIQTTRQHLKNIFKKIGVKSQNALLQQVLKNVFLQPALSSNKIFSTDINGLEKTRILTLKQGKQMSYLDIGDSNGIPVLYFHSINSSRLELLNQEHLFISHGIRLIAIDRVGYGFSSYVERDNYSEYVADIECLINHLGFERVGVLTCSAGAPHGLAFIQQFPQRVSQVHCTSAVPTPEYVLASSCESAMNGMLNKFFRIAPSLMRPALELTLLGQTAEGLLKEIGTGSRSDIFTYSLLDTDYILDEENLPYFRSSMIESLRQGPKAWANENVLVNRPWDISLDQIKTRITFWHGTHDTLIPLEMVKPFIKALPNARLNILDGESHLLVFRQLNDILPSFHHNAFTSIASID